MPDRGVVDFVVAEFGNVPAAGAPNPAVSVTRAASPLFNDDAAVGSSKVIVTLFPETLAMVPVILVPPNPPPPPILPVAPAPDLVPPVAPANPADPAKPDPPSAPLNEAADAEVVEEVAE